jgi:uncharacterized glyoxalase superfamily metalloenzyme YdcJ
MNAAFRANLAVTTVRYRPDLVNFMNREEVATMSPTLSQVAKDGRDELTPDEAQQFASEQAKQYLGMTIEKFKELAAANELPDDDPMVVHIALLAGVELHSC